MARGRRLAAAASTVALLTVTATPAAAAVDLGVFSGPVRFEAPPGVVLDLGTRRYVGTVEARAGTDGITVVDELSFDAYLEGLAEVPVSWPVETLRAQVIAARTYVWWELSQGVWAERGYDVCATQACQVFSGRDIVEVDDAGRWAAAVADTSGQVLVDDAGAPILARYSSSNGGRSEANVELFPDDGDWPYLQAVDDPHDVVSPFHRWTSRFSRADFDAILAGGETLAAAVPVADVRVVPVERGPDLVEVTGTDGTVASVTTADFRTFVTGRAPELFPDRYPGPRSDGSGRALPATIMSPFFRFEVTADEVVVHGRGFGHGVGMSQYGALGKGEAGFQAADILAAYYGGLRPTTPADVPTSVRVGLEEDAPGVSLVPSAPVVVRVGDTLITERGLGTWQVEHRADRTVRLLAPEGYGSPLVVDATSTTRATPWAAEVVRLETVVNKHVELELELWQGDRLLATEALGVVGPGRHTLPWSLTAPGGGLLAPGDYAVALVAVDEEGTRAGDPVAFTVRAPTAAALGSVLPARAPSPSVTGAFDLRLLALAVAAGAVLGGLTATAVGRRGRDQHHPTP